MKRKNTTRNALLTSIISMLLCVSMLVGATFAWFTDSVESGRNTIAAGNLDVELYANGVKVDSSTKLFDDVNPNLWEPGAVAYENLQVKNVGSLALQYTLELNVLDETVVNGYKLSDVIKVGVINEEINANATRDDVIGKVTTWTKLSRFKLGMNALKLEGGQNSDVFGIVLYWQPDTDYNDKDGNNDNNYNMNNENQGEVLKLDVGVSLIATQVQHENDSFGKDYDAEATPWIGAINTDWYFANTDATEFTINTVDELAGLAAIVNGTATAPVTTYAVGSETTTVQDSFKGKTIKLGADIDLAFSTWTPIGNSSYSFQGTFDGGNNTISNLKITGNGSYIGLFGSTTVGEIKNLTVENANITGRLYVGVVSGNPYTTKYTNITVKGHVEVNGMSYVGGVGGKNAYANWDNITVDVDDTSYVKAVSTENGVAYRTYVGGVIGFMGEGGHKVSNVTSNIDVVGDICDVGGIVGIAHYGNQFENITCTGDVTITGATEAGDAEEIGGIAGVWHNGGSDITFTNCSFTGNLSANITEGVDLTDNAITGKAYSASGNGKLIIDGKTTSTIKAGDLKDTVNAAQNGDTVYVTGGKTNLPTLSNKEGLTIVGAADGSTVIGGENAATGFGGNFGKDTTIQNLTFTGGTNGVRYSYANGGTTTFENCTFAGDSTYGFHIDESNGATFVFNNCTFSGFNAFAGDLVKVVFNNCTFLHNGNYGHTNIWSTAEFNNCTFGDKASAGTRGDNAHLFFNGVEESYHHEYIGSAESLFAFAESVNEGGDSWSGQKVVLVADIDLEGKAWTPIGQTGSTQFKGMFDGQNHTIKNLNIDSSAQTGEYYATGLFGWLFNASVKNVNVDTATVVGGAYVGVIAGYLEWDGTTVENCNVTNATVEGKHVSNTRCGDKVGVIVGYAGNPGTPVKNCSATDCTVTAGRDAGQIVGAAKNANVVDCAATNVTVTASGDCTGANINNAIIGRNLG